MKEAMFNNDRYITSGVNNSIPLDLQIIMWDLIDRLDINNRDYLQVFELKPITGANKETLQKITHKQEKPRYRKEYYKKSKTPINEKIFVIDEGEHSVMIIASEY